MSYSGAILEATRTALSMDPSVRVFGEGTTDPAGTYGTTKGLREEFGEERVFDTPVAEGVITGMGIGMALMGLRPIVVHPRNDFLLLAMDQLCNHAAKWRYMFGKKTPLPLTVRTVACRGWGSAAQHSQALHATVAHFPGINVLVPFTPADAKGFLLWAAFESVDPVVIFEHKWLWKLIGHVPAGRHIATPGEPAIIREGSDITLAGLSYGSVDCLAAGEKLGALGVSAEVIDVRSLRPLKMDAILNSVVKTGRLIVVDPAHTFLGASGEVIAKVSESLSPGVFKAKPARVGLPLTPAPAASERTYYFGPDDIVERAMDMLDMAVKGVRAR
ncbi:MAG: alpha-ketoacid dehydrogenase subunit beta [Deltaproteobacteria bacterium]|nr:alpha-ketoacid dehydrogenase subunit beta [Deltaproteobacteria bacterium]